MKTKILSAAVLMLLSSNLWAGGPKSSKNGYVLKWKSAQTWQIEETMAMQMPDMTTGKTITQFSKGLIQYKVTKLFPDGTALISKKIMKAESGPALESLTPQPEGPLNKEQFILMTKSGLTYMLQTKMEPSSPEEAMMMENIPDEVGMLKKAKTTKEWFATQERSPLDFYKLPLKSLKAGGTTTRKDENREWKITRLKDEAVNGATCEVYEAKFDPITETTWFNRAGGYVAKRKLAQGGDSP
ncbi:MAG: hypothetical protein HY400_07520, partial [Elusimicrobia bacterium]|nr:hypothetical protein [Elusimicrobiota bacterium]